MNKIYKRGVILALILGFLLSLCACAGQAGGGGESTTTATESVTEGVPVTEAGESTAAEVPAEAAAEEPTAELYGKPWIDSLVTGNIPDEAPDVKEDLFLHYNYEEIKAHQGEFYSIITSATNIVQNYASDKLEAGTLTASEGSMYSNAELVQLKIFYEQASDLEALHQAGISELQPYLDRVNGATTIEELNNVLVSEDFPFSPYLYMPVSAYDMSGVNNVFIYPELLFVDNIEGAHYYKDSDNEIVQDANMRLLSQEMIPVIAELSWVVESQDDAKSIANEIMSFEKSYGKDAGSASFYLTQSYGDYSAATEHLSLDELAAMCPNYPVKETIEKFGKGGSPYYSVMSAKWLETFSSLWTEENIEIIKQMTVAKIIHECTPYLDPQVADAGRTKRGQAPFDAKTNAIAACNQNLTFAHLIAKVFTDDNYPESERKRLEDATDDLISSFRNLIEASTWLSESSREKMLLKLDKMHKNVLIPEGGYVDFSDLSLTPTEEGGTLLGNYLKVKAYNRDKINARIGQAAQARMAWEHFTPSTINCFYEQDNNSINILPGFVSTDIYHSDMSDEQLLGSIGWVIGHEISHGFDFAGSQFDADGTANSLFDEEDLKNYLDKIEAVVAFENKIEPYPGIYVNGNLVKVEAVADLIGLKLVLETAKEKGISDNEPLFEQCAKIYCQVLPSVDMLQMLLGGDSHPLNYLRTNVNVQMFDELYETYGIQEGDGMYLPEESRIQFWGE